MIGQRAEGRGQRAEGRGQRVRGHRAEGAGHSLKADNRDWVSGVRFQELIRHEIKFDVLALICIAVIFRFLY